VVRRDPGQFGIAGTRWTLASIQTVCAWLGTTTPGSLAHLLDRLKLGYKRGRDHVHSPDDAYLAKLASVAVVLDHGRREDRPVAALYLDELTYYRQPSLARAWAASGHEQPLAERSHRSNTTTRIVGALDAATGRVHYRQASAIGVEQLVALYRDLGAVYSRDRRLYIMQDNWPVHYHPDLLVALEPQRLLRRWPRRLPPSWPAEPSAKAKRRWGHLHLPIQLVPLPTYASWTNPIEKLWRWLKQDILHLHRLADHLEDLRTLVRAFLDQFQDGSTDLLRYVGLLHADGSLRKTPGFK
jgi:hypothetical protein